MDHRCRQHLCKLPLSCLPAGPRPCKNFASRIRQVQVSIAPIASTRCHRYKPSPLERPQIPCQRCWIRNELLSQPANADTIVGLDMTRQPVLRSRKRVWFEVTIVDLGYARRRLAEAKAGAARWLCRQFLGCGHRSFKYAYAACGNLTTIPLYARRIRSGAASSRARRCR